MALTKNGLRALILELVTPIIDDAVDERIEQYLNEHGAIRLKTREEMLEEKLATIRLQEAQIMEELGDVAPERQPTARSPYAGNSKQLRQAKGEISNKIAKMYEGQQLNEHDKLMLSMIEAADGETNSIQVGAGMMMENQIPQSGYAGGGNEIEQVDPATIYGNIKPQFVDVTRDLDISHPPA